MPNKPKKALMYSIKANPYKGKKMEPLEPLPTKDDYANEIDSELSKYEENLPEIKDQFGVDADQSDMDTMSKIDYIEPPLPEMEEPVEYIGPGSPRRKRYEEQMQTEKDAAPMRVLRAAKEGFIEGGKEAVKKLATNVAEGSGIAPAYRAAKNAIKSVGKMASETNRAKGSAEDPAIKELSEMMSAGVITEGDLTRYRRAMKAMKGSKK